MATFLNRVQNALTLERVVEFLAAVVLGGGAGESLVVPPVMWVDSATFWTFTIWGYSAPVLMDDELSVNFPLKKSRDLCK